MSTWLSKLFTDEPKYYRLLLLIGGAIAVLKGLRSPYRWAATQAQLDYRFGFLRRGFFGEICRLLHIPIWRYGVFTLLSFVLLALLFLLLGRCCVSSGVDHAGLGAFSALIGGSFCITLLVNLVGYSDIPLAMLVLLVLLVKEPRVQLVAAVAAAIAGVLIHELYAIAFLPVSLLPSLCWAADASEHHVRWKRWLLVACAGILPWILVLIITHRPSLTPFREHQLRVDLANRVNSPAFQGVVDVLTRTGDQEKTRMLAYMHVGRWWVEEFFGMLAFLPATCFFLSIAWRYASRQGSLVRWWIFASVFSPLLLNFLGYDRYRWLAMMELDSFSAAFALAFSVQRQKEAAPTFSAGWRRAAVFLLMINLATNIGFFYGRAKNFPFLDDWTAYRDNAQHGGHWIEPTD